jgi:hypothetical protein
MFGDRVEHSESGLWAIGHRHRDRPIEFDDW